VGCATSGYKLALRLHMSLIFASQCSYGRKDYDDRTDRHGQIDSDIETDQKYILLIWLEPLPFTCYIFFNASSIPFYFTSLNLETYV